MAYLRDILYIYMCLKIDCLLITDNQNLICIFLYLIYTSMSLSNCFSKDNKYLRICSNLSTITTFFSNRIYIVIYCLKHFHIHYSINLSQKSIWGTHGKYYYFCFTEGETEVQNIQVTFLRSWSTQQKLPTLTQSWGTLGKQYSIWRNKHSHSWDCKSQTHDKHDIIKTQVLILSYKHSCLRKAT